MSISEHKHMPEPVRRIEVFTGAGRRRSWSGEEKAAIIAQVEISWLLSIWNGGAAGERLIAKSRLPVSGDDELGTIQKLGAEQESPGKLGAVEHGFEEVRPLQAGTR